jgi:hypothetical protein
MRFTELTFLAHIQQGTDSITVDARLGLTRRNQLSHRKSNSKACVQRSKTVGM